MSQFKFKKVVLAILLIGVCIVFVIASLFRRSFLLHHGKTKVIEDTLYVTYFLDSTDTIKDHLLYTPGAVRVDFRGNVYVLDEGNHRIVQYSLQGKFIKQIGSIGQGPGELLKPVDFCIDSSGFIYVLEAGNSRVSIFDRKGNYRNGFSFRNMEGGKLPYRICVNSRGEILLNSPVIGKGVIQVYNQEGNFIGFIGKVDEFENPPFSGVSLVTTWAMNRAAIICDAKDNIFLLYRNRPLFRKLDRQGNMLVEKTVEGTEINIQKEREKEHHKRRKPKSPGDFLGTTYFLDLILINNATLMARLAGDFNGCSYVYIISDQGDVLRKYAVRKAVEVKEEYPFFERFSITNDRNFLIGSDSYYNTIYRIKIFSLI